jgi:glycosyltransferase involved in cell wall biosynthesis
MTEEGRRVALVLPAKERFTPSGLGAVGLVVRDILRMPSPGFRATALGWRAAGPPPEGCDMVAVEPGLARHLLGRNLAYGLAIRTALGRMRPDLVEVHNRPDLARLLAGGRRRVALVLHNDPQGMRGLRGAAGRGRLLRQVAGVVCVSAHVRARLLDGVAGQAESVHVLPSGLDLATLPPAMPAGQRDPVLLFVGRLTADKGFDSFVRACAIALPGLPGWRAEAIGADRFGADSPDTAFIRGIRPEAEAAGIRLRGFLDNARTLDAMARAAIVVMPSRWPEPWGRVAQEALAVGAALVASRRGGLPEAAGEAAVYAEPEDPQAIAAAITRLAADAPLRAALQALGLAHVARFGRPETAAAWTALRTKMLAA